MTTEPIKLWVYLFNKRGETVDHVRMERDPALGLISDFVINQGTDPNRNGAHAEPGSIQFGPVLSEQTGLSNGSKVRHPAYDTPLFDADAIPLGNPVNARGSAEVKRLLREAETATSDLRRRQARELFKLYPDEARAVIEEHRQARAAAAK